MDWTNLISPASTPVQVPDKVTNDAFGGAAATWPPMGMGSVDQYLSPWDTGFGFAEAEFMFAHDSAFGIPTPVTNTPPSYLPQSPPSTVSSDDGACLNAINNLEIPEQWNADTIDASAALMELSKMNLDLHIRVSTAEMNKANLGFNDLMYRQGALYIDNYTLAEFMLQMSQNFLQVITRILSSRKDPGLLCASPTADTLIPKLLSSNHQSQSQQMDQVNQSSYSPPSYHNHFSGPLPAPLALTITSIFIQLLSLYELILECITARVERVSIEPIAPVPGLFCDGPGASQVGLLTARQIKVLWSELDCRRAIIPGHAIMRPATLRRLFGKVAVDLGQISADSSKSSYP
ncbi:C6 zinc finger domain protein [Dactylonectria estremocensis]|uniref:C6 zinc finger domain protein n=1 Tax=Dactylonectria estremocensis TaxID=1079267 RepID=A0A9P9D9R2_9HYPO|nr:C6 zinc finger domain protein [Dactylonectria estremocensis]